MVGWWGRYEQEELSACKTLLDGCLADDPDTVINFAAISYKEGEYDDARQKYLEAMTTLGYQVSYHNTSRARAGRNHPRTHRSCTGRDRHRAVRAVNTGSPGASDTARSVR